LTLFVTFPRRDKVFARDDEHNDIIAQQQAEIAMLQGQLKDGRASTSLVESRAASSGKSANW